MNGNRDVAAAPFECDLCGARFETREELRDHVRTRHTLDGDRSR